MSFEKKTTFCTLAMEWNLNEIQPPPHEQKNSKTF